MTPRARAPRALLLASLLLAATSTIIAGTMLLGSLHPPPAILVNQIGYRPAMEKVFIAESPGQDAGQVTFDILDSAGSAIVQGRATTPAGEIWGKQYLAGNFTDVVAPGTYRVRVRAGGVHHLSHPFDIGDHVYDAVLERAVHFFHYQRCGTAVGEIVPGYAGHEACHLDDGWWVDEEGTVHWKDLSGGWHDAGDYGKYTEDMYNTQFAVYHLARAYELLQDRFDGLASRYDTPAPDVVDEATWGARFLQKMTVDDSTGTARLLCGIFARHDGEFNRFGYWGEPASETDNVPMTGDDRMSGSLWLVSGEEANRIHDVAMSYVNAEDTFMAIAALTRTAWIQRGFPHWDDDPAGPAGLLATATGLYHAHEAFLFHANDSVNGSRPAWRSWAVLAGLTGLARWANETSNASAWATYTTRAAAVRARLIATFDANANPTWWDASQALLALHDHDVAINGSAGADLEALLAAHATARIVPSATGPGNVFSHFTTREHFEDAGEVTYHFHYWGQTIGISLASGAAMLAWNATGDPLLRHVAEANVIHWVMGRNPLDVCQVESLGTRNLPLYHHRYASIPGNPRGAVPGTVPNGIARPPPISTDTWWHAPDVPWFDMSPPNPERVDLADFRSNEPYITDNAAFLAGLVTVLAHARNT